MFQLWRAQFRRPRQAMAVPCLMLLIGWLSPVASAAPDAAPSAVPVITNASDFWNIPSDQRRSPHRINLEMVVYYYDPLWRVLWAECAGGYNFWELQAVPLPMRSGQRVRLEGTVIPAAGLGGENVKVTVLDNNAMPAPVDTSGILGDVERLDVHWVSADGFVIRQAEPDSTHLELGVLTDGRVITLRVQMASTDPVPQLANAHIRANFVYVATRDPSGKLAQRIDGWVPKRSDITVLGWMENDPLFAQPASSIEQLATIPEGHAIRIVGNVQNYDPEHAITVRDGTGLTVVRTEQRIVFEPGDLVEVVGRVAGQGLNATLSRPCVRVIPHGAAGVRGPARVRADPMMKLRLADQVMQLRPEEAAQHLPVFLHGVVTWSDPKSSLFFVQDRSGGVGVRRGEVADAPPPPGAVVAIVGTTTTGTFAPEIELQRAIQSPGSEIPTARLVSLDEALTGSQEAEHIEMRGLLRDVESVGPWMQLDLTAATGEFTAFMAPNAEVSALVGSIVRVSGVCTVLTNEDRLVSGVRVWVPNRSAILVEQGRSADPFLTTERTIGSLRQSLAVHSLDEPVRIAGIVQYDRPGRLSYLQEGKSGILVFRRDAAAIRPGQWIEAVGLPGRDGSRFVLREAVWRSIPSRGSVVPLNIGDGSTLAFDDDGRLVTIQGRLLEHSDDGSRHRLLIRTSATSFEAWLQGSTEADLPRDGSVLELTGVYVMEFDEYRRPHGFRIELRSPADVRVLQAASWWTTPRALAIAGGFGVCALLGIAWVVVLRRRVHQQTAQIRAQLEKQARLDSEIERATRLESLGVLAGGIAHDFNNLLTVIIANLGIAAMDQRVQAAAGDILADAERGAHRAAELTQQLLTFAKGGDPVRRAVMLADVVRESAEFARHGSKVRCAFDVEPNLPPAEVDRGQISRVIHNLVLNATQAMPEGGVIRITLGSVSVAAEELPGLAAGRYVKIAVADEGRGIAPEHLKRIFEPYFSTKPKNSGLGLATVHSIIKKHQGHISVRSDAGTGTTFELWLPIAVGAPVQLPVTSRDPNASRKLRVLFMDDDETIRRTAAAILGQLGHEAKIVADGMEVVREYESSLNAGSKYDVVVLDLTVPGGLGGRAAMEILRRIDPDARGIVSSGYSNDPVLANHRAFGFRAVVPKPYVIQDLAQALQHVAAAPAPAAVAIAP